MNYNILKLKQLNAAYIAALEYDWCPDASAAESIMENFSVGITKKELEEALENNQGNRPDEIASEMSDLIKELK